MAARSAFVGGLCARYLKRVARWAVLISTGSCSREVVPAAPNDQPPDNASAGTEQPSPRAGLLAQATRCSAHCTFHRWLPDSAFAKASPTGQATPAAIWEQELAKDASVSWPPHRDLDVIGLTLAGEVFVGDGGTTKLALGAWYAVLAPGAGLKMRAGKRGARLIMAVVSGSATVVESIASASIDHPGASWSKRPGAIEVSNLSQGEGLIWGKGAFVARIGFGGEGRHVRRASLELLRAAKDASIPEHDHPTWEHIAILKGAGKLKLGELELDVLPGALFQIPPRARHAFTASGAEELVAIQLYTPSGPEQRFVMLANQGDQR